jgi:hypothetical protein
MGEVHQINNAPYASLNNNIQVYPTYMQKPHIDTKDVLTKFRPPSNNLSYRPIITPNPNLIVTPQSNNLNGHTNHGHSRERSMDENSDYLSNTFHDTSDILSTKGKTVSKNGLKTVTKPIIPLSGKGHNQSTEKESIDVRQLKSELDGANAKSKNYDEVFRQK